MTVVLDAGALLAAERRHRQVWGLIAAAQRAGERVITHGGVVGQVWRGAGPRAALLSRALKSVIVLPLDEDLGRQAGVLLAAAHRRDVIDAAVVLLTRDGDRLITSDPLDLAPLAAAAGRTIEIVTV